MGVDYINLLLYAQLYIVFHDMYSTATERTHPILFPTHFYLFLGAMTSDFPLQIFDHSYAVTNKADDLTDSSSTTSSSSSEFSLEPKTKFPSEKDSYSIATPKSSPGEKTKSPKRLSTSVHRKTKGIGRSLRSNNRTPLSKIKTIVVSKMRTPACGQCEGCKREDCGHCVFCKDKVKFGGPGKKKQKCLLRACKLMPLKKGAAGKLVSVVVKCVLGSNVHTVQLKVYGCVCVVL